MTPAELGRFVRERVPRIKKHAIDFGFKDALRSDEADLLSALDCAMRLLWKAESFVEMASAADNSGQEYSPQCQECECVNNFHQEGCKLKKFLATLRLVLAEAGEGGS